MQREENRQILRSAGSRPKMAAVTGAKAVRSQEPEVQRSKPLGHPLLFSQEHEQEAGQEAGN